ncbi:MAG: hypothetical protein PWQ82_187 [Thermosediminibacterales bacterium]|nr:hypothetical protein [Thermosediminibacterales bacterium]MDK2835352.1 hypothetical protein [Thermosediminibacterales bacterium]
MHITFGIFLDIIIILTLGAMVIGVFLIIREFFDFFS